MSRQLEWRGVLWVAHGEASPERCSSKASSEPHPRAERHPGEEPSHQDAWSLDAPRRQARPSRATWVAERWRAPVGRARRVPGTGYPGSASLEVAGGLSVFLYASHSEQWTMAQGRLVCCKPEILALRPVWSTGSPDNTAFRQRRGRNRERRIPGQSLP